MITKILPERTLSEWIFFRVTFWSNGIFSKCVQKCVPAVSNFFLYENSTRLVFDVADENLVSFFLKNQPLDGEP